MGGLAEIIVGDCVEEMRRMPENSADAIVTDPPYGLEFMGKEWDRLDARAKIRERVDGRTNPKDGKSVTRTPEAYVAGARMQAWHEAWAREALRVLRPGGHLLAFGGTRTHHRLMCALEDAGFEIRDTLQWIHGQGFNKHGTKKFRSDFEASMGTKVAQRRRANGMVPLSGPESYVTYTGFACLLKPAHEPIAMARKPASEPSIARNVLKHGTGAINIDASRVGTEPTMRHANKPGVLHFGGQNHRPHHDDEPERRETGSGSGRWPSNLLLGHVPPGPHGEPGCERAGTKRVKGIRGGNSTNVGNEVYGKYASGLDGKQAGYADPDAFEEVERWICVEPWVEARERYEYAGVSVEPAIATPSALSAFASLLAFELRCLDDNAGSVGPSGYAFDRALGESERQGFRGGCPPCRRLYDGHVRELQEAGQVSARQLADVLERVLGLGHSLLHSLLCRSDVRPSSWGGSRHDTTPRNIHGSKSGSCSAHDAPYEPESAVGKQRKDKPERPPPEPPCNTDESNTSAPSAPTPSTPCRNAGTCEVFRPLVSVALSVASTFLPVSVSVQELYHQGCPVKALDEQSGSQRAGKPSKTGTGFRAGPQRSDGGFDLANEAPTKHDEADASGASRFFKTFEPDTGPGFFYCAKSSRAERDRGLEGMPEKANRINAPRGSEGGKYSPLRNHHPTVKPLALMRYLVKLVCPPGGTILDPFAGSGSTLVAAVAEGFGCVGIEQSEEYAEIARKRVEFAQLPEWKQEVRSFLAKIERNPVLEVEVVLPPELREEPEGPQGSLF